MSVTFTARCEIALRGTLAAVAAGVMHALHPNPLTVLIVAVSILCSSANIGTTLRLCTHSVVGCALTLPLAWLMLCVSSLEPAGSRPLAATGVIGAVAVPIGYARLPVVARKIGVGVLCLSVLLNVPADGEPPPSVSAMLVLLDAVARGRHRGSAPFSTCWAAAA